MSEERYHLADSGRDELSRCLAFVVPELQAGTFEELDAEERLWAVVGYMVAKSDTHWTPMQLRLAVALGGADSVVHRLAFGEMELTGGGQ